MDAISHETIEQTEAFKNLNSMHKTFALKRANRKLLHHALIVYKTTNVIVNTLTGYNIRIFNELKSLVTV